MKETRIEPEWPGHFPPGSPPQSASDTGGAVFRLVQGDQATPDDMRSWLELARGKGRDCQRAALSCSVTREHLEEVRRASPRRRMDRIAYANLGAEHGKIEQTGPGGHYSLWLRRRFHAEGHLLFAVVA